MVLHSTCAAESFEKESKIVREASLLGLLRVSDTEASLSLSRNTLSLPLSLSRSLLSVSCNRYRCRLMMHR